MWQNGIIFGTSATDALIYITSTSVILCISLILFVQLTNLLKKKKRQNKFTTQLEALYCPSIFKKEKRKRTL